MSENIKSKSNLFKELIALLRQNVRDYAMFIALAVIVVFFSINTRGSFNTPQNISSLLNQTGYVAVLAVGMTLVLIIRQIDLSVGYVAGFLGAVAAVLMTQAHLSEWLVIPIVLVIGICIGLANGFLVARIGVPAFVTTLAGMFIFRGLLLLITRGTGTIIVPNKGFLALSNDYIPDLPIDSGLHLITLIIGIMGIALIITSQIRSRINMLKYNFKVVSAPLFYLKLALISTGIFTIIWVLANYRGLPWIAVIVGVVVFVYSFVLKKTKFGRYVYGIGGNPEASELSGVNVKIITLFIFASMSMLAALSGVLYTSRLHSATTTAGAGFELDAIASAYIGGVSASGGIGKVTNTIIGSLVIMSLTNGMNLMGIDVSIQYIVKGGIFILAVVFDVLTRKSGK